MKYKVNIEELLNKVVEVEAANDEEAEEKVRSMYKSGAIILDASNFNSVEFFIQ